MVRAAGVPPPALSSWRPSRDFRKETPSEVDYTRSPDTTSSAAIDPLFSCTGTPRPHPGAAAPPLPDEKRQFGPAMSEVWVDQGQTVYN